MKTGTIIRIIIWALVALLLIGVLAYFLAGGGVSWSHKTQTERGSLRSAGEDRGSFHSAAADSTAAELEGVREIEIEWTNGRVNIVPTDGAFDFYEDYDGNEKYQMVYRIDGSTLKIHEFEDENTFFFFLVGLPEKELTVELPRELYDRIDVEAVSAKVSARDVRVGELDVETVSGMIDLFDCAVTGLDAESVSGAMTLSGCEAAELDLDSVSGKIQGDFLTVNQAESNTTSGAIELSFESCRSFDGKTVSGRIDVTCFTALEEAELDTTSGKMRLIVPDGCGANVKWDTVSGDLQNDTQGDRMVKVNAGSVSGDLTIENAAKE